MIKKKLVKNEKEKHSRKYLLGHLELGFADLDRDDYNMLWDRLFEYEETNLTPCEIVALKAQVEEHEKMAKVLDKRKHRRRFIKEWRTEYQKELDKNGKGGFAGLPDEDYVYQRYFELKAEIDIKNKRINVLEKAFTNLSCDIQFSTSPSEFAKLWNYASADHRMKKYISEAEGED